MTKEEAIRRINAIDPRWFEDMYRIDEVSDRIISVSGNGDWDTEDAQLIAAALGAISYMIHGGGCESCGYGAVCEFVLKGRT